MPVQERSAYIFDTYTNIIITNVVTLNITLATIIHVCARQCIISCLITILLVLLCQWITILLLTLFHPSAFRILYSTHEVLAEYLNSTSFLLCMCYFKNVTIYIIAMKRRMNTEYYITLTLYYAHGLSFIIKHMSSWQYKIEVNNAFTHISNTNAEPLDITLSTIIHVFSKLCIIICLITILLILLCQRITILVVTLFHPFAFRILYSTHEILASYLFLFTLHMAHDVPLIHPSAFKQWKEELILTTTNFDLCIMQMFLPF